MTESDYTGKVSLAWTASGAELDTGTGKHLTMFIVVHCSETNQLSKYKIIWVINISVAADGYEIRYSFQPEQFESDFRSGDLVTQSMIQGNFNLGRPRLSGETESVTIRLPSKGIIA